MKSKFVSAYSVIAFVLLAVAVLWFCVSVFSETARGSEEAELAFSWLCREASQHSYSLGFMSDAYIEEITDICERIDTLIAMTISSPAETFYAWAKTATALAETETGREIRGSSLFSKVLSSNVDMGANTSPAISVTASLRTISSLTIFAASRNAFILVFFVLLSSIIVLLITPARTEAGAEKESGKESFSDASLDDNSKPDSYSHEAAFAPENTDAKPESIFSWSNSFAESTASLLEDYALDKDEASGIAEATETEAVETEEVAEASETETDIEDYSGAGFESFLDGEDKSPSLEPDEPFSSGERFGGEEDFEESLNSELIRAASSEQDVSILILRVFGLNREDVASRVVSDILMDMFKREDLIFEFESDAYACIIPGAMLDETMQTAEHLYNAVQDSFNESNLDYRTCIGISTRANRTVPASKMIEEANTAARKAEEEKRLPIVAFRANPQKYRLST